MATTQITAAQGVYLKSNPGFILEKDAALAWDRSVQAFGKDVLITGAWRSYATQERIFRERYRRGYRAGQAGFTDDVRYWPADGNYWTRLAGTAAAAVPGTSNHGGGVAVDVKTRREAGDPSYDEAVVFTSFNDADRLDFLRVAAEHGWYDDEGRQVGELWHLTYYPDRDQHKGEVAKPPRAFHRRVTTRATHVYTAPGRGEGRLLPEGYEFTVWDGVAQKRFLTWYVQTTSGNWVRSRSTRKI